MNAFLDRRQIIRSFSRAAATYAESAVLQREIGNRLLESLEYQNNHAPRVVLDIGSGPGEMTAALKNRWPKAQVIATDITLPMLRQAKTRIRWRRAFSRVCGDAQSLPFANGSIDLIVSNLCLPWVDELYQSIVEFRRVLRPNGRLLCTGFGPGTLQECREAFERIDTTPHILPFPSISLLGDMLIAAGFRNPVLDCDRLSITYPNVDALLQDLRMTGSTNVLLERRRTLTGRHRLTAMKREYATRDDGNGIIATVEALYAQAWAPEDGVPIRDREGETASIPVASIPIKRKNTLR